MCRLPVALGWAGLPFYNATRNLYDCQYRGRGDNVALSEPLTYFSASRYPEVQVSEELLRFCGGSEEDKYHHAGSL